MDIDDSVPMSVVFIYSSSPAAVEYEHLRNNPDDIKNLQWLRGLVTAARQIEKSAYPNIRKFAFDNPLKSKPPHRVH